MNHQEINRQTWFLPEGLEKIVKAHLRDRQRNDRIRRLWRRDASLWTGTDEDRWLDWLEVPGRQQANSGLLRAVSKEMGTGIFSHALLLGMGGSSLCPDVLTRTFGKQAGFPELIILDSTDPGQVASLDRRLPLPGTLFIVSSKSGTTLESHLFLEYFFDRASRALGRREAGRHFIAITDPGSALESTARQEGFLHIFPGEPGIGGRYSALSHFGLIPAAVMGIEVERFLNHTEAMVRSCGPEVALEENPGGLLGMILGIAAKEGRDKVSFLISPGIRSLGAWLEQLLAESTGKSGRGLIPVDGEEPGPPEVYGEDRLFVSIRLENVPGPSQDRTVDALRRAGQPLVEIVVKSPYHLGQEFFRWEVATAVAGSVLGIHPFDQPDVEASKAETRRLTAEFEKTGRLPAESPFLEEGGLRLFSGMRYAESLKPSPSQPFHLAGSLKAHLARLGPGDYLALLGYLAMTRENEGALQRLRHRIRDKKKVATCLGFGPRFLHSTGQLYKGGPNTGVFLQITADDPVDLPILGKRYTFGNVKAAQALGDFRVLTERSRRALRVHLTGGVEEGWARLEEALREALP